MALFQVEVVAGFPYTTVLWGSYFPHADDMESF
jgi:hypothetical protein